jgi:hypothetical protein
MSNTTLNFVLPGYRQTDVCLNCGHVLNPQIITDICEIDGKPFKANSDIDVCKECGMEIPYTPYPSNAYSGDYVWYGSTMYLVDGWNYDDSFSHNGYHVINYAGIVSDIGLDIELATPPIPAWFE